MVDPERHLDPKFLSPGYIRNYLFEHGKLTGNPIEDYDFMKQVLQKLELPHLMRSAPAYALPW
jgi:hypothetical protein